MRWGTYGFAVEGLDAPSAILTIAGPDWPTLGIVRTRRGATDEGRPAHAGIAELTFDDERAVIWLSDTESVSLDRFPELRVTFMTDYDLSDDLVAHPFIGLPAAVASRWLGRQILHGGGIVVGDQAWAVLGTKEAGKSSTLGWLARDGHGIVSDDLLMLVGTTVFAGPRSVDLRSETADVLGGDYLQIQAGRTRHRLRPAAVPGALPLGGIVYLEWGSAVSVEEVPPIERLPRLIQNSVLGPTLEDSAAYLDLATLPTVRFVRPRGFDGFAAAIDQLLAALA
ncbi:MAG TPA: hypothetical protein VFB78_19485 [Acidimicrobiales bacterium]|nr:hypothetical protein [Acidimicrobiales bacterium]